MLSKNSQILLLDEGTNGDTLPVKAIMGLCVVAAKMHTRLFRNYFVV